MSPNLDLVRSIYADWERGDFSKADWADPEIEFVVAEGPEPGSRTGLAARPWVEGFLNIWENVHFEAEEYSELDDGRALVVGRMRGRGKGSGVEIDQRHAFFFNIEKGRVTRIVIYWDRDRALADLGLEEWAVAEESTTPDLVELVHRSLDAASAGDIDGAMSFYAPNAVTDIVGIGVFEGQAAIRAFFEDWQATFEDFEVKLEEIRDLGNGVVFGVVTQRGRLPDSPSRVQLRYGFVQTWADGLIERTKRYDDIDQARAAAERLAQERG